MHTFRFLFSFFLLVFQGLVATDATFSLMSWNILGPLAPDVDLHFPLVHESLRGQESKLRFKRIVKEINNSQADIVCLQEASSRTCQWLYVAGLDRRYVVGSLCRKGSFGGTVVLFNKNRFDLVKKADCELPFGGAGACVLLGLKQSETKIAVCSLHIARANDRRDQAKGLQQIHGCLSCMMHRFGLASIDQMPIVVAGDFNTHYEEMMDYVEGQKLLDGHWNMFRHESWTASSPHPRMQDLAEQISQQRHYPFVVRCDGSFVSIDHVLYQNMRLALPSIVGKGDYVDRDTVHNMKSKAAFGKTLIQDVVPSDHLPVLATLQVHVVPAVSMYQRFMLSLASWFPAPVASPKHI